MIEKWDNREKSDKILTGPPPQFLVKFPFLRIWKVEEPNKWNGNVKAIITLEWRGTNQRNYNFTRCWELISKL